MSPYLILAIVALFIAGAYLFLRNWKNQQLKKLHDESKASLKKNYEETSALLRPVYLALELGETPVREDVERLAVDPRTRYKLYKALSAYNKKDLFPARYAKPEALAESQLVSKIRHAHALGKVPDEIQFEEKVSFKRGGKELDYYVFRLKPDRTHRFADKGWVRAICGPYEGDRPAHGLAVNVHLDAAPDKQSAQAFCEKAYDTHFQELEGHIKEFFNFS